MRLQLVFSPDAADDLRNMFAYIAEHASALTAERYVSALIQTAENLQHFPYMGFAREDIRPGLRVTHHKGRTTIAYAVGDDRVTILRFFHGGADWEWNLKDES